ncbi:hypothetical protein, partial [Pseudomonas syringae]|uniref:hypothetical protein n=1 Tax=Pseudomonas syringae TaxID=317 RepID=UPI0034D468BC
YYFVKLFSCFDPRCKAVSGAKQDNTLTAKEDEPGFPVVRIPVCLLIFLTHFILLHSILGSALKDGFGFQLVMWLKNPPPNLLPMWYVG